MGTAGLKPAGSSIISQLEKDTNMASSAVVVDRGTEQFRGLFSEMWFVTATVDPASVAAEATQADDITVPGLALGDMVIGFAAGVELTNNLAVQVHVKSANTLKITYTNNNVAAGAAIDLGSSKWSFLIGRPKR